MWACEHVRRKRRREREREKEEEEEEEETSRETTQSSLIRISDVITMSLVGDWAKNGDMRDQTSTRNCGDGGPRKLPHVEDLLNRDATNTRITKICRM